MTETAELTSSPTPEPTGRGPISWRPVWLIAGIVAAIHLAVATRFGWHRDEFYYVICGRHPAWGYVDQPPLTPFLARLAADLPSGVLPLRILAIAAEVGCVVLTAVLAAEFGGRRRAQIIAAAAVAVCPVFVGASMLFGTTVLDQLAWVAVFVLVARALRVGTVAAWLFVGIVAGIGLENKDTIAVLLLGIAIGLPLFRRDALRTPGPWLAGVVAIVLALPNIRWDAENGWPNLAMAHSLAAKQGGPLGTLIQMLELPILLCGPPLILFWFSGVRWLGSRAGRAHRWTLVVAIVAVVVFTAANGKNYYPAPVLAALFAAGAVRAEAVGTSLVRVRIALAISAVVALVLGLPVLPVTVESRLAAGKSTMMETYGWPRFVSEVEQAAATLPPDTPIFTSNYGEAGALTMLGPSAGIHQPVYSGHDNYTFWGPPPGSPDRVLCVGMFTAAQLRRGWSEVREIAPITLPDGLVDSEVRQHAAIYECRRPHGTWARMWPRLRHFD